MVKIKSIGNAVKKTLLPTLLSSLLIPQALLANVSTSASVATPTGQLTFSLKTAGPPIQMMALSDSSKYLAFQRSFMTKLNDGPSALALIREFDNMDHSNLVTTVQASVERAVDPNDKWTDFYEFMEAPENDWSLAIIEYTLGNESDDEQIYVTVNRELRDGRPDSAAVSQWTKRMREAMWRLPRFEGISFRGTRLKPEQIEKYYQVGKVAQDLAFISTSLSPTTAFKFADPDVNGVIDNEKVSIVFVVLGKTGRPVSNFAHMHSHEQEILFANGTPMTVKAKTPVFQDSLLNRTQIILLEEN
ncbi:ADP-ribosyltransferase [Pseudobdellovibrio exovorus]|uniref:Uncharacterized protein n=1 Tax=Pseudobdellovibrio exovorus JSS TaxID=1184267 RepID=M4V8P8_9BACT|nr:ADP-ribosyltransferase [Pseudobdellovibrio exovorus]AGH95777.1 hypothetical protein A11Q_1561 [Pseudobdellovibrio exovorus JSS]